MPSKSYLAMKEKVPTEAVDLATAVAVVKENARKTFDETVELEVSLGVDPERSEQTVRGTVVLPAGLPKKRRIVVFTDDQELQQEAVTAGAVRAGGAALITEVAQAKKLDADVAVATPEIMRELATIARILGPAGLMPNPKTGTVTADPVAAVAELTAGKLAFKMDQQGNLHQAIGKMSWAADRLVANAQALLDAIMAARPSAIRGQLLRRVTLKSTMGPGVRVVATK